MKTRDILFIITGTIMMLFGIFISNLKYKECIEHGFSRFYCLNQR